MLQKLKKYSASTFNENKSNGKISLIMNLLWLAYVCIVYVSQYIMICI